MKLKINIPTKIIFCIKLHFRSEYGAFWKCIQAGGIYMFTQLCKMLVLATFFPFTDNAENPDLISVSWEYLFDSFR